MLEDDPRPPERPAFSSSELRLQAAIVIAVCAVFAQVLLHPGELVYSPHSDLLAFHHPYRVLQRQSLATHGRPALWDPTSFGGMPLAGDPEAGLAYPPTWLHALDPSGEGEAWFGWNMLLHALLGAIGMAWWLRGRGFGQAARFAGASAFALSGKWFYHVVVQGHVIFLPLMWLPWLLGLVDRLLDDGADASTWRRTRQALGLGAMTALVITGSHPQLLLYAATTGVAYAAFAILRAAPEKRRAALPYLALALAFAAGLSAIHLLPVVMDLDAYLRGDGLDYATAAHRALTLPLARGLLVALRLPAEHLQPPFGGALALALAPFALFDRERRAQVGFFFALLAFCIVYAFGASGGLHRLFFELVPGYDLFRIPTRIFLIVGLPLGFLAAAAIDVLTRAPTRVRTTAGAVLAAAGLVFGWAIGSVDAWIAAACLAAPLGFSLPMTSDVRATLATALALMVYAEQARSAAPLVETRPLDEALGHNEVAERLRAPLGEGRILAIRRGASADLSALPTTYATRAGLESLRGFNPLIPRATHDYLFWGVADEMPPARSKTTIPTFEIRRRAYLDLFNVRWVVTHAPLDVPGLVLRDTIEDIEIYQFQRASELTRIGRTWLYENVERMPRAALVRTSRGVADFDEAIARIASLDPRREVLIEGRPPEPRHHPGDFLAVPVTHRGDALEIELDAGGGGVLVLSEVWYPGWRARVDGEAAPLLRVNAIFSGLELGPGRHRVMVRYLPTSYRVGRAITLGSLCAGLAFALWVWRAQRRPD